MAGAYRLALSRATVEVTDPDGNLVGALRAELFPITG